MVDEYLRDTWLMDISHLYTGALTGRVNEALLGLKYSREHSA